MLSEQWFDIYNACKLKILERNKCSPLRYQQQSSSSPVIIAWPHAHALLIGIVRGEPETVDKSTYKQGTPETKKSGVFCLWLSKRRITLLLTWFWLCVIVDALVRQTLFERSIKKLVDCILFFKVQSTLRKYHLPQNSSFTICRWWVLYRLVLVQDPFKSIPRLKLSLGNGASSARVAGWTISMLSVYF